MTADFPVNTRPVTIRTAFPGSAVDEVFTVPYYAVLTQAAKGHDVLRLYYTSDLKDPSRLLRTGAPVTMTWGVNALETRTWHGYVHTTSPRRETDTTFSTEVICVSPSMILSTASQDTWNDRTDAVMADIIRKFQLNPILERHPRTRVVLAGGRTYWQVLRELATETGYSLACESTNVVMTSHRAWFDKYHALAKVYHPGSSVQNNVRESDRTLWSFTPRISDRLNNEYADSSLAVSWWVDPYNVSYGQTSVYGPTTADRRSPQTITYTERVSDNAADASQRGADRLADKRWVQQAELIGSGSPLVAPYRPVYVMDYHVAADGWWQVIEVTHTIHQLKSYEIKALVGRDGSNITYPAPSPRTYPAIPVENMQGSWRSVQPVFRDRFAAVSGQTGFGDVGGMWVATYAS